MIPFQEQSISDTVKQNSSMHTPVKICKVHLLRVLHRHFEKIIQAQFFAARVSAWAASMDLPRRVPPAIASIGRQKGGCPSWQAHKLLRTKESHQQRSFLLQHYEFLRTRTLARHRDHVGEMSVTDVGTREDALEVAKLSPWSQRYLLPSTPGKAKQEKPQTG